MVWFIVAGRNKLILVFRWFFFISLVIFRMVVNILRLCVFCPVHSFIPVVSINLKKIVLFIVDAHLKAIFNAMFIINWIELELNWIGLGITKSFHLLLIHNSKKDNDMLCSVVPHLNSMLGDSAQYVAVIKKIILCSMQLYKVAMKVRVTLAWQILYKLWFQCYMYKSWNQWFFSEQPNSFRDGHGVTANLSISYFHHAKLQILLTCLRSLKVKITLALQIYKYWMYWVHW